MLLTLLMLLLVLFLIPPCILRHPCGSIQHSGVLWQDLGLPITRCIVKVQGSRYTAKILTRHTGSCMVRRPCMPTCRLRHENWQKRGIPGLIWLFSGIFGPLNFLACRTKIDLVSQVFNYLKRIAKSSIETPPIKNKICQKLHWVSAGDFRELLHQKFKARSSCTNTYE